MKKHAVNVTLIMMLEEKDKYLEVNSILDAGFDKLSDYVIDWEVNDIDLVEDVYNTEELESIGC